MARTVRLTLQRVSYVVSRVKDALLVLASIAIIVLAFAYVEKADQLSVAEQQNARYSINAVQSNVDARYDDCQQANSVRAGLRASVQQSKITAPLLYRLIPALDIPEVRAMVAANDKRQLIEYRAVDCVNYARRAIPAGDPHHYHVP